MLTSHISLLIFVSPAEDGTLNGALQQNPYQSTKADYKIKKPPI